MNTWYIRIWPEAAHLRNNNIDDKRLKPLNDILKKLDATMTLSDRTGTGDDCHYKVEFEGDQQKSDAFLNAMIFGAQEVSMTLYKPIDLDNESTDPEIMAKQEVKRNFWRTGIQVEEEPVISDLRALLNEFKSNPDRGLSDQPEP